MYTLEELAEKLALEVDEVDLLEMLNINSFDLVAMFMDRVEERYEQLSKEFDE